MDFVLAAGALLGGLAVLLVSFYTAFVVIWLLLFVLPLPVSFGDMTTWAYVGSGLFLVVVFFESWRTQRRLFENYSDEAGVGGGALSAGLYLLGVGWGPRGVIPLSPGTSRNLVKVVADILYSGPRLLRNSVRLVRRGRAKATADLETCTRVLSMALEANGRLTFEEITRANPGIDLAPVLEQLSWLDGVVYLKRDPPGLTLTDSLRAELEKQR